MIIWRRTRWLLSAGIITIAAWAHAQVPAPRVDPNNRLNNPFRTQFRPAWTLPMRDLVMLVDVGPVTDAKRSNLVLLVSGSTTTDTQRRLRILHWNGNSFDLDSESNSQSIGIDTLLLGKFHPGAAPAVAAAAAKSYPVAVSAKGQKPTSANARPQKPVRNSPARGLQVLTNSGIFAWSGGSLQPVFARQLPDVKQSIVLDNRSDLVLVGAGDGSSPFEFTESEMRPATREKLQGNGYARFGIGLQPFPEADKVMLAPGIRYTQAIWTGRTKWLIGLIRGKVAGTVQDPAATTGDRLVVYTPKFQSRDKSFWESRMDDFEQSWQSDPITGRVLDVRVGDPHNDGKVGILVLTAENEDKERRLTFYVASSAG